jgi:hypothetical protein
MRVASTVGRLLKQTLTERVAARVFTAQEATHSKRHQGSVVSLYEDTLDALSSAPTHGVTDAHFVYNVTGGAGEKAAAFPSLAVIHARLRRR